MARFVYEGYDQVIGQADRAGEEMHARVERALRMSADILVEELQRQERDTFKAPTGEMGRILEETPELTVSSDYSQVVVYPKGDYTGIRGKPRPSCWSPAGPGISRRTRGTRGRTAPRKNASTPSSSRR